MFVDKAQIEVKGGDGGNGCCSFRREKFVPKGGPDGGDGGRGGNVILRTDPGEQSLVDMVYNRHFKGERGAHGKGKKLHGKRGADRIIRVPIGTVISDVTTGELIVDLDKPNTDFTIAKGGDGGRGNIRFVSSVHKAPMECEAGYPGEEKRIQLELKTIADFGLVGYPNAGKSTFLSSISNARPKVASYPFTTLHPIVGVLKLDDFSRITIADIPGLIDGAHDNIGLGHSFLKHIERTKILIYVLDMAGVDGRQPWDDYNSLKNELELYMKGLSKRKSIIFANKMDLPESEENLELLKIEFPNETIIPISASEKIGIEELPKIMLDLLEETKEVLYPHQLNL